MSSILGSMDATPAPSTKVTRKRKPSPDYSSSPIRHPLSEYRSRTSYDDLSSDGPLDDGLAEPAEDLFMSPKKKARTASNGDMIPATEWLAHLDVHSDYDSAGDMSFDDFDMDAFMEVDKEEINGKLPVKMAPVQPTMSVSVAKNLDATPSWLSLYDSLSVAKADPLGPLAASNSVSANSSQISALEPDGSLRFYWLDYLEHEGKLYFVGKLKDKVSSAWVSCCVTVEGIQRNLFVLPREKRIELAQDGGAYETDVIPTPQDVHSDFELIRKQIGVKSWKGKFVKRKYAFSDPEVPRGESQWLKVVYGFNGMFSSFFEFCCNVSLQSLRYR
jgi:DNA polymerase alpha subunit A